jgi:hypothetical protein
MNKLWWILIIAIMLIIIIVPSVIYRENIISKFENYGTKDIIMFINPTNEDSIKMMNILGTANLFDKITVVNVLTPEGKSIIKQYNIDISILPLYICTKTGKKTDGIKKDMNEIKQTLK